MNISNLLSVEAIIERASFIDKTSALIGLSQHAAEKTGADAKTIEAALGAREALGSTGVGNGVAIPHARIDGLSQFFGLFVRLDKPIDFSSIDEKPVDLLFLLLIPPKLASQQVSALATISRRLREKATLEALRSARDPSEIYKLLIGAEDGKKGRI